MTHMKPLFTLVLFGVLLFGLPREGRAQEDQINWLTIEEAEALSRANPKKIFVDVYTDWCSWCRRMSSTTYTHPVIIRYINENFYPVKLNAEQSDPITFRGTEFINQNAGQRRSAHDFAIALLRGKMGYPSVAFFDENLNLITAISGYRPPEKMEPLLVFFSEDVFKESSDLDGFISGFEGSVK
ncbi:MAG: DUF255 domain-containing protein [Bacteroidales bacterium]